MEYYLIGSICPGERTMRPFFRTALALLGVLCVSAGVAVRPASAYYDDVHYALTYYICRQSGYTPLQAYRIASACSATDWDPDTEPVQPIGQLKILTDPALGVLLPHTRYIDPTRWLAMSEIDLKILLSGFKPMTANGQDPRWKFHAMRNEREFSDVIGRGA